MIIDVDSHFEPGPAWLDDFPELRAKIPVHDTGAITTEILAGEILADVPRDEWPSVEHLVPPGVGMIVGTEERPEGYGYEGSGMHNTGDAAERIAWLDQNGIDAEAVICLEGMLNARFLEDRALAREIITTSNTWMADAVAGYTDRLFPTTCLDFSDVVKENVYATDLDAFIRNKDLRKAYFGRSFPAATWVQVQRLYVPSLVVEVELTARFRH